MIPEKGSKERSMAFKPPCPCCGRKTVIFYVRTDRLYESKGFYCRYCGNQIPKKACVSRPKKMHAYFPTETVSQRYGIEFTYLRQPPNRFTFAQPKTRKWVEGHVRGEVLNLFAGKVRLNVDEFRVDMSPEFQPDLKMDAFEAVLKFVDEGKKFDSVILDPPYSLRMAREKYHGIYVGKFKKIIDRVPEILKEKGVVVTLGYKTEEMSRSRGFTLAAICIIRHGGGHDATLASQEVFTGKQRP